MHYNPTRILIVILSSVVLMTLAMGMPMQSLLPGDAGTRIYAHFDDNNTDVTITVSPTFAYVIPDEKVDLTVTVSVSTAAPSGNVYIYATGEGDEPWNVMEYPDQTTAIYHYLASHARNQGFTATLEKHNHPGGPINSISKTAWCLIQGYPIDTAITQTLTRLFDPWECPYCDSYRDSVTINYSVSAGIGFVHGTGDDTLLNADTFLVTSHWPQVSSSSSANKAYIIHEQDPAMANNYDAAIIWDNDTYHMAVRKSITY